MKKLHNARTNPVARVTAFLLCLVMLSACFWTGFVTIAKWDDIWLMGDYSRSGTAENDAYDDYLQVRQLLELKHKKLWSGSLTYSEGEWMKNLEAAYTPDQSNFRYQIHDEITGEPIMDNLAGESLDAQTHTQYQSSFTIWYGNRFASNDKNSGWSGTGYPMLVYTGDGYVECDPAHSPDTYNEYGWFADGEQFTDYNSEYDERIHQRSVVVEYGISFPMMVADKYSDSAASYGQLQHFLPVVAALFLLTLLGSIALLVFLCSAAGRREDGTVAAGWQEKIPYDLYLCFGALLFTVLLWGVDSITFGANQGMNLSILIGLAVFTLGFSTLVLALILTTAVRLKKRILWRTSLIGRFCRSVRRTVLGIFRNWPITRRAVILFLLYLVGTVLTGLTLVLIPVYQGFVLWLLCRWVRQWSSIREGTARIVGGDPEFKIDTMGMFRDLRAHAGQLNDMGGAISSAVDERIKSERFKAELITNVSHDLKTPLTSIINYVGLLKHVPIENPQAAEYIEVLDRKSQRLKKLTEDLVDASKASTGSLSVNLERLGMGQLLTQALGEYEEKFALQALEVVFTPPEEELYVWADGRHLWRVVDNLFGNCAKYAMEHTRIYLELRRWDGNIFLSIKNISRQPLNVPPEQLMERFVRGDEARSTEGSGLGLSIARSLTDLQQGTFRLDIDGDLFKATVSFPEAVALPQGSGLDGEATV